jgi:putative inorganic carbon (hco3(-)) transporter
VSVGPLARLVRSLPPGSLTSTPAAAESAGSDGVTAAALATLALLGYQLLPLPLALFAAIAFLVFAWARPLGAVSAVVLALPHHETLRPVAGSWSFSAAEVGICLVALGATPRLIAGLLPVIRRPRSNWRGLLGTMTGDGLFRGQRAYFDIGVVALVALGMASLAVSIRPWESLRALRQTIVEPALLYAVVVSLRGSRSTARRLALAIVASAVLVSLLGLYQYATNQNIITAEESLRRIRGLYGSPNHLGMFLGRALPIAVTLATLGGSGRRRYALAALPIGLGVVLTFSLGAWVGVAAALVVVAVAHGRKLVLVGGSVAAVLAAISLPFLLSVERIATHFNFSDGTSFLRLQLWGSALNLIWDHPLAGVGLDNFLYYYRDLGYMLPGGWREPSLSHPHNLALDFWLSLGLVGLILLLAVLYRFFRDARLSFRQLGGRGDRALALAAAASMVDFVAHGMIDASYFRPDLAVIFWLTVAILRLLPPVTVAIAARNATCATTGGSDVPYRSGELTREPEEGLN